MKIDDYRKIVHEDVAIACEVSSGNAAEEFLAYTTGLLINGEEFDDFVECHCDGLTRRKGRYGIDGYSIDETDGSCCIFVVDYHGPNDEDAIRSEDVSAAFKRIRFFVEESIRYELFREIPNQSAMEFSRDLYYDNEKITRYRFYLLTDAYNRQRAKTIKDETINGRTVELNVWDITRIFDLVCSQRQKESVEIHFSDFGITGIPCVKAVDHVGVVADIDVSPVYEKEDDEDALPENIITYSSYLAVVPGEVLNQLYLDYGAKLLEGNVRSFLSAKGKVNRSIQTTIKNYPEMFFAYNNGIAATATQVEVAQIPGGPVITYIKDLQIVNGGQTTASIANTLLTAKKGEVVDLSKIAVPMKLSVLEHSMAERIIPKISEYSNSQNKVEASDFFSNHPFHIRMEEYSRKTAIPARGGNQFQQYWFYERARGQYNQGKMKFANRAAELKKYTDRYPESQVITMLDLAKYMELYFCRPDVVSKGKQKTLQRFAEEIKAAWEKGDTQFNEFYFKRMVALAIIYKRTDEIIKQSAWYKENRSYKANVIAYTISIIFNHIRKKYRNYELDFKRIWNEQNIYEELEEQITVLQNEVHNFITGPRSTENVTEWCKKELCWTRAQEQVWTMNHAFLATLVSKEEVEEEKKEHKQTQKIVNEVNALKEIYTRGPQYWSQVLEWGISRRMLSEKEVSILKLSVNMFVTGRIISDKQAQVVIAARKRLIKNGMPMQF
jgi:hypothetical protein